MSHLSHESRALFFVLLSHASPPGCASGCASGCSMDKTDKQEKTAGPAASTVYAPLQTGSSSGAAAAAASGPSDTALFARPTSVVLAVTSSNKRKSSAAVTASTTDEESDDIEYDLSQFKIISANPAPAGWAVSSTESFRTKYARNWYKWSEASTSLAWKHGGLIKCGNQFRWVCFRCGDEFAFRPPKTSNFARHLSSSTSPRLVCECDSSVTFMSCFHRTEHQIRPSNPPQTMSIITAFEKADPAKANAMLCRMLVMDSRPVSMVDSEYFRQYVKILKNDYTPPCRQTVRKRLDLMAAEALVILKRRLSDVRLMCAVSTDGWLSPTGTEFVCAVVHYITADWQLQYHLLKVVPVSANTTADALRVTLLSIFGEFGIVPHTIVSDQAANIQKAIRDQAPLGTSRTICVAHNLNLVVNDTTDLARDMEEVQGKRKRSSCLFVLIITQSCVL